MTIKPQGQKFTASFKRLKLEVDKVLRNCTAIATIDNTPLGWVSNHKLIEEITTLRNNLEYTCKRDNGIMKRTLDKYQDYIRSCKEWLFLLEDWEKRNKNFCSMKLDV